MSLFSSTKYMERNLLEEIRQAEQRVEEVWFLDSGGRLVQAEKDENFLRKIFRRTK